MSVMLTIFTYSIHSIYRIAIEAYCHRILFRKESLHATSILARSHTSIKAACQMRTFSCRGDLYHGVRADIAIPRSVVFWRWVCSKLGNLGRSHGRKNCMAIGALEGECADTSGFAPAYRTLTELPCQQQWLVSLVVALKSASNQRIDLQNEATLFLLDDMNFLA